MFGNSKIGDDLVPSQEQTLQKCKSLVDRDSENKVLTLWFSEILKLGALKFGYLGEVILEIWKNQLVKVSSGSTEMCVESHSNLKVFI